MAFKVVVNYIGTIHLTNTITLHDVLYVPGFQFNLVSIPKICHDLKCFVIFDGEDCLL